MTKDLALMEDLKNFFNNLVTSLEGGEDLKEVAKLYLNPVKNEVHLRILRANFIKNVLIPFFDVMIWRTKKEKDYQD